jgi:ABC-type multidrug transport system permease subunit
MIARLIKLVHARNLEFIRDKSSLGWNLIFPILLVFGLAFVFSGDEKPFFKVAVLNAEQALTEDYHPFFNTRFIQFYKVEKKQETLQKVARHQVDMLINLNTGKKGYWVNSESPKSYLVEKLLLASDSSLQKNATQNKPITYLDWVIPGVLGMNIMFSCLFGVGFVIVRYRKNGYLKRLNATPLSAFEFILAQLTSRLLLIVSISVFLFTATHLVLDFTVVGSFFDLFIVLVLGCISMIALSLLITSRVGSEELAGGLLNVISWPMMFLSGVWFSLEGTDPVVQVVADFFPLTHILSAARAIMIDGQGLSSLAYPLGILSLMTVVFLALGAWLFQWSEK